MDNSAFEIPSIAVDIIKTGFHGAAIALVWVAFSHLRHISNVWEPAKLTPEALPVFRELTSTTRFLLIVSTLLFVIGVGAQLFTKPPEPTHVTLNVSPRHWTGELSYLQEFVEIVHGDTALNLQGGQMEIITRDRDSIAFNIERLVEDIRAREEKLRFAAQADTLRKLRNSLFSSMEEKQ